MSLPRAVEGDGHNGQRLPVLSFPSLPSFYLCVALPTGVLSPALAFPKLNKLGPAILPRPARPSSTGLDGSAMDLVCHCHIVCRHLRPYCVNFLVPQGSQTNA